MELDKSLSLPERQSLSAKRTHQLRHKDTESKIRAACRGLQERGEALTMTAIAALAGVTRQTVANYGHILNEVSKPSTVAILGADRGQDFKSAPGAELLSDSNLGTRWPGSKCCHSESETGDVGSEPEPEMLSKPAGRAGDRGPESCHSGAEPIHAPVVKYGVHQITARSGAAFDPALKDSESEDSS